MKQQTRNKCKAYRFRLHGHPWMTYVGPVRNKIEAEQALLTQFGEQLREVRLCPLMRERTTSSFPIQSSAA